MKSVINTLEKSWFELLEGEFEQQYFLKLLQFLQTEFEWEIIFPPKKYIFEAFNRTVFSDVKVVILGQDPYHGLGQAHGLSFSVPGSIKTPPSLRNIFKELNADLGKGIPLYNDLTPWTKEGVLLLNATLTVRAKTPGSHQKRGWEEFTDAVIQKLSNEKEGLVFILWGSYAQNKGSVIDTEKHFVINSAHPSPFSAHRGFLGSKPFSKTNAYLRGQGLKEIDWAV